MRKFTLLMAFLATTMLSMAQLSGTYTVGTGGTYATLKAAADDLNTVGMSGNVLFEVVSDISETAPVKIAVASGSNTITIKPAATKTPTLTFSGCVTTAGATSYTGLGVDNTNNIIIDGSNTTGGTTKDMTFKMNDGTNGRNIIQLFGNCDNSSVINLNIIYQAPMSTANSTRGIYLNGQSTGACDNFTVENCVIGSATLTPYYGLGATGSSGSSIYCTNIIVKNNDIYGRIRPVYFYYVGTSGTSTQVENNTISTFGGVNGTTTYTIMWNTWAGTLNILNNKLINLTVANTSGTSGVYGISGLTAAAGSTVNVFNNFVGGNIASTGVAVPAVFSLMYIQDNATYNVFNNTFDFQNLTNATEKSNIHISGSNCIVNLKNNIIINNTDATNAYCVWKSNGTLNSDYNNLYVSGASANIGYVASSAKKTLTDWQAAGFNYDKNSKSVPVFFTNATTGDLHLAGASVNDVNLAAPLQATVANDIDGTVRTAITYKGAHQPSDMTAVAKQFTVTVPSGTDKVYIAGDFTGKSWDNTDPLQLTAQTTANVFSGIFPCVDGVNYKYLCEKGDWEYQDASSVNPLTEKGNRTYNANDVVDFWKAMPKVTLNVSFASGQGIPANLFVKGSWNAWATPIELTKSGDTYSGFLGGNPGDKIYSNTEYKYYTNDITTDNWEVFSGNRWSIYPTMTDVIASFTTPLPATGIIPATEMDVRIIRTQSGITAEFNGSANVELYSINGAMIDKTVAYGSYTRDLNPGAYIIRINGKATKFIR